MTTTADEADLKLAHELADRASEITLPAWRGPLALQTKADGTTVTDIDLAVDDAITATLAAHRPKDFVHSEELSPETQPRPGRRWYIDPLDQTVNYTRGLPEYATLIALYDDETPICAVISAPALRERWWASRGRGARNTTGRLRVSSTADIGNAVVSIAAPHRFDRLEPEPHQPPSPNARALTFAARCKATTGAGGFLGHMRVAEGRVDATLDPWGEVWDLAASALIVQEAGGTFTAVTGEPSIHRRSAIASNGLLHSEAIATLAPHS